MVAPLLLIAQLFCSQTGAIAQDEQSPPAPAAQSQDDGDGDSTPPPPQQKKRTSKGRRGVDRKETEGTTAANRFEADTVIKSQYKLNGEPLEVDPD